jgi:hypothetical protein
VAQLVASPGAFADRLRTRQPFVTDDNSFNRWFGPGIKPREPTANELKLCFRLRDFLSHNEPQVVPWFEGWGRFPLVHPGVKFKNAVLLQGAMKRTGKSLLGNLIRACYGHNGKLVKAEELKQAFNPYLLDCQFIVGDEILGDDRRQGMDFLKNLIDHDTITINLNVNLGTTTSVRRAQRAATLPLVWEAPFEREFPRKFRLSSLSVTGTRCGASSELSFELP